MTAQINAQKDLVAVLEARIAVLDAQQSAYNDFTARLTVFGRYGSMLLEQLEKAIPDEVYKGAEALARAELTREFGSTSPPLRGDAPEWFPDAAAAAAAAPGSTSPPGTTRPAQPRLASSWRRPGSSSARAPGTTSSTKPPGNPPSRPVRSSARANGSSTTVKPGSTSQLSAESPEFYPGGQPPTAPRAMREAQARRSVGPAIRPAIPRQLEAPARRTQAPEAASTSSRPTTTPALQAFLEGRTATINGVPLLTGSTGGNPLLASNAGSPSLLTSNTDGAALLTSNNGGPGLLTSNTNGTTGAVEPVYLTRADLVADSFPLLPEECNAGRDLGVIGDRRHLFRGRGPREGVGGGCGHGRMDSGAGI
ncbi:hypothetical protein BDZ85DRAFT_320605 [Elsinoe ampelina]|uniref:Uncharacterized protein n=1 Tax=Elsinoe ampelina TaxID=302913 RepID=A0A6A6G6W9_9PEZI|nr:hypothetical protein BDZ85DRAFT_320605 [Elsinoe ampelina]